MKKLVGVCVVAMTLLGTATVADVDRHGAYVGIAGGQVDVDTPDTDGDPSLCGIIPCNISGDDTTIKLYGGYRWNKWIALEGSIRDFGEVEGDLPLPGATFSLDAQALDLFVRGGAAVGAFDFFAKLGWAYTSYDFQPENSIAYSRFKNQKVGWAGGLGIQANIKKIGIRVEWESFDVPDFGRWDSYTAGVQYRFQN